MGTSIVVILELGFALGGAVLLWRLVLSPTARVDRPAAALPGWDLPLADFLVFLISVMGGSFLAAILAGAVLRFLPLQGDAVTVFHGAAAQLGMLAGTLAFRGLLDRTRRDPAPPPRSFIVPGIATFLISLPVLIAVAKLWEALLEVTGLPTDKQDLIGMFAHADSPWLITVMILLAVVIAPLGEELVFRAGLFRYLRTRLPRWIALLLPALFFASLHVNWTTLQGLTSLVPLAVLAIIFSLAYERTGHIGTAVVAHALFNLNTVGLIFSGIPL